jgi:hypothetical protein
LLNKIRLILASIILIANIGLIIEGLIIKEYGLSIFALLISAYAFTMLQIILINIYKGLKNNG